MSASTGPREQILASLRHYSSMLEGRKTALSTLAGTSERLRVVLESNPSTDISSLLGERERDCRRLAAFSDCRVPDVANTEGDDELRAVASSASALENELQGLGDRILACQAECEAIMKGRLEAISKAIRESGQRRRLDAAYGPACSHETPMFLDRQR